MRFSLHPCRHQRLKIQYSTAQMTCMLPSPRVKVEAEHSSDWGSLCWVEVAVVVVVPLTPPGISSPRHLFTIHSVLTVCLIILVFAVCLFEPLAPTNSVPGLTQDGSLRHILSVSQPAEDIRQHLELR